VGSDGISEALHVLDAVDVERAEAQPHRRMRLVALLHPRCPLLLLLQGGGALARDPPPHLGAVYRQRWDGPQVATSGLQLAVALSRFF
jgi:hypothetical protein